MLITRLLWLGAAAIPSLSAMPLSSASLSRRCTNVLQNPSFESGDHPWQTMALGSWQTRGVFTSAEGGSDGRNFFYAHTNATVADATINLSQYGFSLSSGATVDCSAWVSSRRPGNVGSTRVEVILDGQTCGDAVYLGTNGWIRVGGKVKVEDGPHTLSIVVFSDEAGPEGASIWVDDAWVTNGC